MRVEYNLRHVRKALLFQRAYLAHNERIDCVVGDGVRHVEDEKIDACHGQKLQMTSYHPYVRAIVIAEKRLGPEIRRVRRGYILVKMIEREQQFQAVFHLQDLIRVVYLVGILSEMLSERHEVEDPDLPFFIRFRDRGVEGATELVDADDVIV